MTGYVDSVREGVLDWLESVRYRDQGWGRWKYNAKMARPWALQASGIAIGVLDLFGKLPQVDPARRAEAVAFFQGCQDSGDGLFRDPLETEADHVGEHTWEQIWGQRNGAALDALQRLGAEPLHPPARAQFADLSKVDGRAWTLSLDWTNPWRNGESWSRAIKAYCQTLPPEQRTDALPVLRAMFEAVEGELLDPASGYPTRLGCDNDPSRAMAGLFKLRGGYAAVGRPWPHAERAIDSTLALQHDDGEFGYRRNMCINWDSLVVLRELDLQLGGAYRHGDIVAAGNRLAKMLLRNYRKADGGFAFHGERCMTNHHSIRLCEDGRHPISDMLGTRMSLRCLEYADEWNGA